MVSSSVEVMRRRGSGFIQKENKVTVTQHVQNIENQSVEQNSQLPRALEFEDQEVVIDAPGTVTIVYI